MKILFLSWAYPKDNTPYLGIWAHQQALALKAKGVDVEVVNAVPYIPQAFGVLSKKIREYAHIPKQEDYEGIKVYHPRLFRTKPQALLDNLLFHFLGFQSRFIAASISREIDLDQFQIIHAHNLYPDGVLAYRLSKRFGIPYVLTLHDVDKYNRFPENGWLKSVSRKIIAGAEKVFAVSHKVKNNISPYVNHDRMDILYNTFWTAERTINRPQEYNIVIIASLIERKGVHILLQAYARIVKKYSEYKLIIIGNGDYYDSLKTLAWSLGIGEKVLFKGTLSHPEAMEELATASIFCLPSWDEAFGVVYAEAMSFGIPIIGCKGEGIADIISDRVNGLLVESNNVSDLEQALNELIQNPERTRQIGIAGKEKIRELHPDQFGNKLVSIYHYIISVAGRSTSDA
ncbi:glycosyltransferase [Cohnella herbarum]|uniref:Glycosyltransferase family 4 protein n=1 Tax=Cohnella herbarum TaxID=2728023 RepID=A0A7Z2VQD8_9BACL|nr:glycosyltransferase [Cohnella herbarum]QJD87205.1 glycosyltransferase family 4 protein [Cohnella herbarum]